MESALEKILNLAKKTGDNVIVYNPARPKDSYVILALNSYERLVEDCYDDEFLTEDYLDDKINGEIEPWTEDWQDKTSVPWEEDEESFLPEDIFGQERFTEAKADDEAEKEWEEEVNYLYPTEEEFAAMAKEEIIKGGSDFNSVADILGTKHEQKENWSAPTPRQDLENLE